MKIVKTYEAFINEAKKLGPIDLIKKNYTEYDVKNMIDEEIPNWVEEDQIGDEYEGAVDWYYVKGAGEVEEFVIDQLINWYEKESGNQLSEEKRAKLSEEIIESYPGLDPNNY